MALQFSIKGTTPFLGMGDQPNPCIEIGWAGVTDGKSVFFVRDNGIGIEEKYLERIFKPFERLHSRASFEGSGVGLAICQKIVSEHRGMLKVESNPGKGTTFTVLLP